MLEFFWPACRKQIVLMKRKLIILLFACGFTTVLVRAATLASNGSQADVNAKIVAASAGDTITIPAGSFIWGAGQTSVLVNKAITLSGAGETNTTIVLSPTGPYYGGGVINISAAANVTGFTITGAINTAGGPSTTPITASNTGWRVHHVTFNGPPAPGYFAYCSASSGLFDHITINSGHGSLQTFMIRGASSVWSKPHTMGTSSAVFVEDSTFNGPGYMNENDGGAQTVLRFNTVTGDAYIDAHQFETSSDANGAQHGSRQIEAYDNKHTTAGYVDWCELSCGTGMVFDNSIAAGGGRWPIVQAYGAHSAVPINGSNGPLADPAHLPIPDQIGMGPYPQSMGAEPLYCFNNTRTDGSDVVLLGSSVSSTAIAQYGSTFYQSSVDGSPYMLKKGRDYFNGASHGTFPSTSDVGRGTKAAMLASSPTTAGQGWWVTNEGSWNTKLAANTSGQLYKWSGSAWVLYYTPYTYPHPLQGGSSQTVQAPSNAVISIAQ